MNVRAGLAGVAACDLLAVLADDDCAGDDAEFDNQRSAFPGFTTRAGFRLVVARAEDAYAGFG